MAAMFTVFAVVLITLLITRVASISLSLTGLSRESARFQARSALSGVGFTTTEAEAVVQHPVRRRIILALMLVGSAGLVTAAASLIVSFGGVSTRQGLVRGLILLGGLLVLWLLAHSRWVDRRLSLVIERFLRARGMDVRDYAALLDLTGDYVVSELSVEEGSWLAGRTLEELRLRDQGVVVLGVQRADGGYLGIPKGETAVEPGDTLIVYSREGRLREIDRRPTPSLG